MLNPMSRVAVASPKHIPAKKKDCGLVYWHKKMCFIKHQTDNNIKNNIGAFSIPIRACVNDTPSIANSNAEKNAMRALLVRLFVIT